MTLEELAKEINCNPRDISKNLQRMNKNWEVKKDLKQKNKNLWKLTVDHAPNNHWAFKELLRAWRQRKMRYKVIDEDGVAVRLFATKAEALSFLQDGWSIAYVPKKPKPTPFELVGECLF